MKVYNTFESYINEGAWAKIMKDVKANSETGPWSIIAVEGDKVVGQEIDIKVKDMIPAAYEAMRKEYPKAKLHIEDATGAVVWNESVEINEGAFVVWYEDKEGKHLLGTFHNKKAAEKYKSEEEDEMLNTKGVEKVGMMSKDMWDKNEAPYINEGKIQLKRRYTENYPTVSAGKAAPIRNKVIEAIADGKISNEEFKALIKELSSSSAKWIRKNAKYFNVSEDGITLSKYGMKILSGIKAVNENKNENVMIHTTFESFLNEAYSNEGSEFVFEAFKSSKLASLLDLNNMDKQVMKGLYGFTKVKLDQVTDDQLVEMTPYEAYKSKRPNALFFYIVDNEKENPYADASAWSAVKRIPAGTLIAVADGNNKFYGVSWGSRWSTNRSMTLSADQGDGIGMNKRYKGYDASGLYNVKRIADLADRVLVFDWSAMPSSAEERDARSAATKGAVAFMSDKEFKAENIKRYKEILQSRAMNDDIDKTVEEAVNELADQIKSATRSMQLGKYGDLLIGTSPKGQEVRLRDASSHMSNILDSYSRYVDYLNQAKKAEEDQERGSGSYYKKEAAAYAKDIKDRVSKISKLEYAW